MSSGDTPRKPPAHPQTPAGSPPGSGEGAQSALAAMIRKRQMRAQQDEPAPEIPVAPAGRKQPATQAQQPPAKKPDASE